MSTPFIVRGGTSGTSGTKGTLVAQLFVSGSVSVDPSLYDNATFAEAKGRANMFFWATGLNASGCSYYSDAGCLDIWRDCSGDHIGTNNPLRAWTLHIPVEFDHWSSFQLPMWASARSYVNAPGTSGWIQRFSESDFEHTLRWGGITRILDANSQSVSGWKVESLAGLDLTVAAVPEPSQWLLIALGLAGLAVSRRRRPGR